ncbi:type VI secretion system baseplate subunit TssK [Paraburkholderia sediminicola]|uniref:type VI secretion system baseplate subunit TssK n=1 Tax=Paraburkholderia TaxID=1822464 RepID=UPI0038B9E72D
MNQSSPPADLPYGLQWSEGLLLSPQHLQQNDRFWHAQLRYLIERANPDFIGVRHLELDEGLLGKGRVTVRALECVLDDGTPVVLDKSRDRALELDVSATLTTTGDRARVALVLPLRGDAAATSGSMNRRYESVPGVAAVDENTGRVPVLVPRLKPVVRLETGWTRGTNLLAGCSLFELERTSLGTYRCTDYLPPLASLAAAEFQRERSLQRRVCALRDSVRMKLREIAQVGEGAFLNAAIGDAFLALAARRLAAILPELDVLGLGADVALRALYLSLARAAGEMAALDPLPDPPVLPPYDHFDCQPGFDAALGFIEDHVTAIRPSFERLPFQRDEGGEFSLRLPLDAGEILLVEVVPSAAQNRADLERWLESCTISHPQLLDPLDSRRMPGASVQPSDARRKGLNPTGLYYEIRNAAFDFDNVMRNMFAPGEMLTIRGGGRYAATHAPGGIVLYREPGGAQAGHEARGGRDGRHAGHGGHGDEARQQGQRQPPLATGNGEDAGHAHN